MYCLQAPALVFYNNAEFTAADWDGIKAVYSSVKKDDPLKIGRFGLGFKAVFHMTGIITEAFTLYFRNKLLSL